ncbi:MFS transporter [Nitratireductor mangrovi]|uniref:MFS transporter n=1 Tax=Nitratireductor mangrovi TaxID=2599600 RepID=A0A5B8L508_9HYPH|nr:MFS transporter [Nitratireductor mangrovi]QDZ03126.1 MFS transporter [Nitratireductor mangrovi]
MPPEEQTAAIDWRRLWASGDLARFIFISLGILLHATNETMVATIMPAMVAEISGVTFVGWTLAMYELGSITAGAAAGRMISYLPLRSNMAGAALVYGIGALICALAPGMGWLLAGRLVEGLGGGALVALAFVSVERLFPRLIWPQLFAIISVVWGVSAFSGPLLGALLADAWSWRWAFGIFAVAGFAMAAISFVVLSGPAATRRRDEIAPPFPATALACLAVAVTLIAWAGVASGILWSAPLLAAGLAGLVLFFRLDALRPASRLFPERLFDRRTTLGAGMVMVFSFSIATISFTIYGPLLLTSLHGISPLTAGYIVAAESIAWSVLSILVANAAPRHERTIITTGALMIAAGVAGFAWAVPAGSIPAVLACALLQGGGFGIAWPFVTRIIVAAARPAETTITSSAIPTLQRIGYAVGAAGAGIIANASGFAHGLSAGAAAGVATWLFLAFVPLGLVGLVAGIMVAQRTRAASTVLPAGMA